MFFTKCPEAMLDNSWCSLSSLPNLEWKYLSALCSQSKENSETSGGACHVLWVFQEVEASTLVDFAESGLCTFVFEVTCFVSLWWTFRKWRHALCCSEQTRKMELYRGVSSLNCYVWSCHRLKVTGQLIKDLNFQIVSHPLQNHLFSL